MRILFPYQKEKAEQAALWLLHRHGGSLPILKLIKLVFYADRAHLLQHGRPITGGKYAAMPHGPVCSNLYAALNAGEMPGLPFNRTGNSIFAMCPVNEDFLSQSDLEILEQTNARYGTLDAFSLRDATHDLNAWKNNFKPGEQRKSFDLPYEDFFSDAAPENQPMLELIRDDQSGRAALD